MMIDWLYRSIDYLASILSYEPDPPITYVFLSDADYDSVGFWPYGEPDWRWRKVYDWRIDGL